MTSMPMLKEIYYYVVVSCAECESTFNIDNIDPFVLLCNKSFNDYRIQYKNSHGVDSLWNIAQCPNCKTKHVLYIQLHNKENKPDDSIDLDTLDDAYYYYSILLKEGKVITLAGVYTMGIAYANNQDANWLGVCYHDILYKEWIDATRER